ncbi:MAG: VWA domain-containing protein [Steroidobacteraceae bacterium]
MRFSEPLVLLLLPLALLPLLRARLATARYPWLELVPADRLSNTLGWLLRAAAAVAIAATAVGLSGPYLPGASIERVGRGAEIVVLLDRSLSMDEPLGSAKRAQFFFFTRNSPESKQSVARRFLSRFVADRGTDLIGLIVFSTFPIPVLPFTSSQALVQAAIRAGSTYHGLADTDIGAALLAAAAMFKNQPYTGSRVVLLLSDGGAMLDTASRVRIRTAFADERIALDWIYLRSYASPGIAQNAGTALPPAGAAAGAARTAGNPELALHRFFLTLLTPYHLYQAESPKALHDAIADVGRAQTLPIRYSERLPRLSLAPRAFEIALIATAVLLAASLLEVRRWP